MPHNIRLPADVRIVFDGQSMNIWPPVGWSDGVGPYPNRLMKHYSSIPWVNIAIGDTGWGEETPAPGTGLSTTRQARRNSQARNSVGKTDILILAGGQADIYSPGHGGADGADAFARMSVYTASARAAGFHKVIATTWPALGPDASVVVDPAEMSIFNGLVMLNSGSVFDGVVNWHSAPLNDATNTTYFESDRVHVKDVAADILADRVKVALDDVLATL